ncbi:MAG: acetyl-CoA carboxylase carboxyl transferase subunit alpha, partial [Candidatus Omnitrophica bacterium]|nr:acetyl-CoA carboxylase carboxyl transferase subunit alpha [Candidatus Omnitrophota bacterium]
ILWKDGAKAPEAAEVLKLTAHDLYGLGLIDEIIPEPLGGAHRDPQRMAAVLKDFLLKDLKALKEITQEDLLKQRYKKFRKMGAVG